MDIHQPTRSRASIAAAPRVAKARKARAARPQVVILVVVRRMASSRCVNVTLLEHGAATVPTAPCIGPCLRYIGAAGEQGSGSMKAEDAADMMDQEKAHNRFRQRAAVTIAIFAMLLAIAGLGGANAGKEAVNNNVLA